MQAFTCKLLPNSRQTARAITWVLSASMAGTGVTACGAPPAPNTHVVRDNSAVSGAAARPAAEWVIASDPATPRPPFAFSEEDDQFLDEVQRASFWYLWNVCDPVSGMVRDRTSRPVVSIAGVGFQLAAIPAAVERKWITRAEGEERALRVLRTLEKEPTNRKAGMFFHFLEGASGKPMPEDVASTIDSAIFFAGAIACGEYFKGETREIAGRLFAGADWSFFVMDKPRPNEQYLKGFITLGWKPESFDDPTGAGSLTPYAWADAADEQRLVSFLAAAAPRPEHRVEPTVYYRLRRMLGEHGGSGVHVWFPWSGALFTHIFAHCFLDYSSMGPDNPALLGVERRPRVDWWENSRRGVNLHRIKAREAAATRAAQTLGEHAWGLTASDAADGYAVPGVFPARVAVADFVPQVDFADWPGKDNLGDGTVAPYGAGCAVMFEPKAAIAALRHYRGLKDESGAPLVWRDPGDRGETGEQGFRDSFNLGTGWVAPDGVAIDHGPLVLAIENARSGLIWRLFHSSEIVQEGMSRLKLERALSGSQNRR